MYIMTLVAESTKTAKPTLREHLVSKTTLESSTLSTPEMVVLEGVSWDTYKALVNETGDEGKAHFAYNNGVLTIDNSFVVLEGVSWDTYEALVNETGNERKARFAYSDGVLEIAMPLGNHESIKHILERIITTLTEELELPIKGYASTTFNQEGLTKGAEPDACFYIKSCEHIVSKGARNINLSQDPAPDLVIEIDISHMSTSKMEIYAAMGVAELWRFYKGNVEIYYLRQGNYQLANKSLAFPMLASEDLAGWLDLHKEIDDNALIRIVRKWLREHFEVL